MPSGRTHDVITILLTPAAAAASHALTWNAAPTAAFTAAFLFGGLMFGPDLDTVSKQYARWSLLRVLWFPYRICFGHRSRWSHGLIFGALFRVIYFAGVLTIAAFGAAYLIGLTGAGGLFDFAAAWAKVGSGYSAVGEVSTLIAVFAGLWAGAASHTFTDIAVSYIKTGRVDGFL